MFSKYSSSFHILNGDKRLKRLRRLLYFPVNRINNKLSRYHGDLFTIEKFTCQYLTDTDAKYLFEKDSPSRRLSNLFWINLPWAAMQRELGALHLFDTGCGKGDYAIRFQEWSGHRITAYCGLDSKFHEHWQSLQEEYPFIHLKQGRAENLEGYIPEETNVFVTQSSLEHIELDLLYFQNLHEFILRHRRNTIQVHLLPAPICLDLYRFHGVRQYTPRTIEKIVRIFNGDSYATLYALGGSECGHLHMSYITSPIKSGIGDLRDTQTQTYKMRLQEAIEGDMAVQDGQANPVFYALVIHSFYNQKIF